MTHIMKRLAPLGAVIATLLVLAVPAFAGNSAPASTTNVEYTDVSATSDNTASFTDVSSAFSTGSTKEQIRYTMPNGLPKAQRQRATKCLVATNDTRPARAGEKCGHIKIGTPITNSGVLRSTGRFGMFADVVHVGDTFYLNGKQWRKDKCGNKVWFKFSQSRPKGRVLPASQVEVVRNFSWTASVTVIGSVKGSTSSLARCWIKGKLGAEATSSADGEAYATATATATASSKDKALITARGNAQNVFNTTMLGNVKVTAQQNATVNLNAKADVWCSNFEESDTTTPNTPPHGPPPAPPEVKSVKITSMTTLNDIPEGKNSGPFYVTINASATGGSATIDPGNGGVSTCDSNTPQGSVTFDNLPKGNSSLCVIVWAPGEPSAYSGSVSVTATLGSASDFKIATFLITHPTRPE